MHLDKKYKELKPNQGNPDANYERQMLIREACVIIGEASNMRYWFRRFGGPRVKSRVPDNLIIPMAKRARENGRTPAALLNTLITRWRASVPRQSATIT